MDDLRERQYALEAQHNLRVRLFFFSKLLEDDSIVFSPERKIAAWI